MIYDWQTDRHTHRQRDSIIILILKYFKSTISTVQSTVKAMRGWGVLPHVVILKFHPLLLQLSIVSVIPVASKRSIMHAIFNAQSTMRVMLGQSTSVVRSKLQLQLTCVTRRENALFTEVQPKCGGTHVSGMFFSLTSVWSTWSLPWATHHWKNRIVNWWIKPAVERAVHLVCACCLASQSLSLKSWKQVNLSGRPPLSAYTSSFLSKQ